MREEEVEDVKAQYTAQPQILTNSLVTGTSNRGRGMKYNSASSDGLRVHSPACTTVGKGSG